MQKWPTDIPDIVRKQVCRVAETGEVDELIACPMGGGKKSLEIFVASCKDAGSERSYAPWTIHSDVRRLNISFQFHALYLFRYPCFVNLDRQ